MSLRTERVASLVKEQLGMMFLREYRDPAYGLITIMDVQMTPDLRIAKIYVSIFGNEIVKKRTLDMLEEQKPHIRQFIGSHIRIKFTPTVQLYMDDTLDKVDRIEQLIKKTHEKPESEK
jgi:ribosome-binding factor A